MTYISLRANLQRHSKLRIERKPKTGRPLPPDPDFAGHYCTSIGDAQEIKAIFQL